MRPDGQVLVNLGLIHRDNEWQPYWSGLLGSMRARLAAVRALHLGPRAPACPGTGTDGWHPPSSSSSTTTATTILAGQRTGRRVRAIELAPAYVDLAMARWRMLHPDMPVTLARAERSSDA
jgi:hypothetical protein